MEINLSLLISLIAVSVSIFSACWAIKSWRETYRPLITARVAAREQYGVTALHLVLRNTGNRPALKVGLSTDPDYLEKALLAKPEDDRRIAVERCFAESILVIENGSSVSLSFGAFTSIGKPKTWKGSTVLDIRIKYEDLDGRKYSNYQPLRVKAKESFLDPEGGDFSTPS